MKMRIAIYGGTDLSEKLIEFVKSLTRTLLNIDDIVIISGGFHYWLEFNDKGEEVAKSGTSVDMVVMNEALEFKEQKKLSNEDFEERFETWIPKFNDRKDVRRFKIGKVEYINGSSQSRRFKIVQNVDAIVTIGGNGNSRSVIELALAMNKPVLPIRFSGNDSGDIWEGSHYAEDIIINLKADEDTIDKVQKIPHQISSQITNEEITKLAIAVANIMTTVGKRICLVLMPFSEDDGNKFYFDHLVRVILNKGYIAHRIDQNDEAGNIPDLFFSNLDKAKRIIVDITNNNANVMYELGHVHSKHIKPLIIRRGEPDQQNLPFYFLHEMVHTSNDKENGYQELLLKVEKFLESK